MNRRALVIAAAILAGFLVTSANGESDSKIGVEAAVGYAVGSSNAGRRFWDQDGTSAAVGVTLNPTRNLQWVLSARVARYDHEAEPLALPPEFDLHEVGKPASGFDLAVALRLLGGDYDYRVRGFPFLRLGVSVLHLGEVRRFYTDHGPVSGPVSWTEDVDGTGRTSVEAFASLGVGQMVRLTTGTSLICEAAFRYSTDVSAWSFPLTVGIHFLA